MTDSEIREWYGKMHQYRIRKDPMYDVFGHLLPDYRMGPYLFLKYVYENLKCEDCYVSLDTVDDSMWYSYYVPPQIRNMLTEKDLDMFWGYGVTVDSFCENTFIQAQGRSTLTLK